MVAFRVPSPNAAICSREPPLRAGVHRAPVVASLERSVGSGVASGNFYNHLSSLKISLSAAGEVDKAQFVDSGPCNACKISPCDGCVWATYLRTVPPPRFFAVPFAAKNKPPAHYPLKYVLGRGCYQ